MKEVTVYTVQAHQTWGTRNSVEYFEQVKDRWLVGIEDDDSATFVVPDHIELPVHHICRRVPPDGSMREEFIAIDRDLLRILSAITRSNADKLRQEVADLQSEVDQLCKDTASLQVENADLSVDLGNVKYRRNAFIDAPLWRRLWIAIRPGRYFT